MASRVKDWTLGPVPGVAARPETYHERWVCDSLEQQIWHLQWATTGQQEWGKTEEWERGFWGVHRRGNGLVHVQQTYTLCWRTNGWGTGTSAGAASARRIKHADQRTDNTRNRTTDYRRPCLPFTSFNITKQWVWASRLYARKWQKQNCISRVLQLKEGGEEGVGRGRGVGWE